MVRCTNLTRRGAKYYVRVAIPADLQAHLKKAEIWKSLRTEKFAEAKERAHEALLKLNAEWAAIRSRLQPRDPTALSDDVRHQIAGRFYREELELDQKRRASLPTADDVEAAQASILSPRHQKHFRDASAEDLGLVAFDAALDFLVTRDAAKLNAASRAQLLVTLRKHLGSGETALVEWAADEAIRKDNLSIDKGTVEYRRLCQALQRAWIEVLKRAHERDEGDFSGEPSDAFLRDAKLVQSTTPTPRSEQITTANAGETISELFEDYARENPRRIKTDTLNQARKVVHLFVESLPSDRFPVERLGKKEVREWRKLLLKLPVKAAEIKELRGLTIREVVDKNAELGKPAISTRTINKYLSMLAAFCRWLAGQGYIDDNPVRDFSLFEDGKSDVRPYRLDELQRIFSSPIFSGCKSEDELHVPGDVLIDDHRRWLPIVSLFSGARLGEIAQLFPTDVRQVDDIWLIDINDEDGKTLKNDASKRIVPIHQILIDIGFVDYVKMIQSKNETRLFPKITCDTRQQIAGSYSRFYGRYTKKIGVKTGKDVNFHSYRHTFIDSLRSAGYRDAEFNFLVGHTNRNQATTANYGILSEGILSERVKFVKAVEYPGLNLAHLKSGASAGTDGASNVLK